MTADHGDHSDFEMRLVKTGEIISFNKQDGYTYRASYPHISA
jgi:hypothetical protein